MRNKNKDNQYEKKNPLDNPMKSNMGQERQGVPLTNYATDTFYPYHWTVSLFQQKNVGGDNVLWFWILCVLC